MKSHPKLFYTWSSSYTQTFCNAASTFSSLPPRFYCASNLFFAVDLQKKYQESISIFQYSISFSCPVNSEIVNFSAELWPISFAQDMLDFKGSFQERDASLWSRPSHVNMIVAYKLGENSALLRLKGTRLSSQEEKIPLCIPNDFILTSLHSLCRTLLRPAMSYSSFEEPENNIKNSYKQA